MKNFVRLQTIPNVLGRLDYIFRQGAFSTKELSEQLVYFHDNFGAENWKKLANFEIAESERLNVKTNQARELIIALPNGMNEKKDAETQYKEIASTLASGQPYAFAVHWNKSKNNLHMHLLLSERQKLNISQEPKRYRQDIWAKEDGSRALKVEDRHHIMHRKGDIQYDKDGNIKYKSAENSGFSLKNKSMQKKSWLLEKKQEATKLLKDLGYEITSFDSKEGFLAEKHEGKGNSEYTQRIKRENSFIRSQNIERAKTISRYKKQYAAAKTEFLEFKKDLSSAVKSAEELEKDFRQSESICTTYDKLPETAVFRNSKAKYNKQYPKIIRAYLNLAKFFAFWRKKASYKFYLQDAFNTYKTKAFNKYALLEELTKLFNFNFLELKPLELLLKPFNDAYTRFKAQNGYISKPKFSKTTLKTQNKRVVDETLEKLSIVEKIKKLQSETEKEKNTEKEKEVQKKITIDFER